MWKLIAASLSIILCIIFAHMYVIKNYYCPDPSLNIVSRKESVEIVKKNIRWFTNGRRSEIENLESFLSPAIADPEKPGNGWGAWETEESKNSRRQYFVMYNPKIKNGNLSIECIVACGELMLDQCTTLDGQNLEY